MPTIAMLDPRMWFDPFRVQFAIERDETKWARKQLKHAFGEWTPPKQPRWFTFDTGEQQ